MKTISASYEWTDLVITCTTNGDKLPNGKAIWYDNENFAYELHNVNGYAFVPISERSYNG